MFLKRYVDSLYVSQVLRNAIIVVGRQSVGKSRLIEALAMFFLGMLSFFYVVLGLIHSDAALTLRSVI